MKQDTNCYVLLWNLNCTTEQQIAPGLAIRPLGSELSVFDLAAAGAVGFREWATLEVMASACRSEIESAKDASVLPGYDTLNRAWLVSAMMVFRGCGAVLPVAVSSYSWSNVAGFQERGKGTFREQVRDSGVDAAVFSPKHQLPPFVGGLLDYRLKFLTCPSAQRTMISEEDCQWIHSEFERFNALAARSDRFRFSLEAAVDWRFAHDLRSAIARIWAGVEAVFGISAELVYRIAITAASLLRKRGPSRVEYAAKIKKLYGIRSKAVHGDAVRPEVLSDALEDSFVLLRDLLLLVASRGSDLSDQDLQKAIMC